MLYTLGTANLNAAHVAGIVGTRKATERGRDLCTAFVRDLAAALPDVLIVSGLAYGIDVASHRASLSSHASTVGVLAHGLDRIYPSAHRSVAAQMTAQGGGLVTEYMSQSEPERQNFVQRNRIIAGMSDAVVVVESAAKGGALITADYAQGYNRDCFAFPGRVDDPYSCGCNNLIRSNAAALITSAADFLKAMDWAPLPDAGKPVQRQIFVELSPDEERILAIPGNRNSAYPCIYYPESGTTERLTFGNHSTHVADISPDGTKLLLQSSDEDVSRHPYYYVSTLSEYDLTTRTVDTIYADKPYVGGVEYSPDGTKLLFTGGPEAFDGIGKNCGDLPIANDYDKQAYIMDLKSREVEAITRDFDPSIENVIWNRADGNIYLRVTEADDVNVYVYSPKTRTMKRLPLETPVVSSFVLPTEDASVAAYYGTDDHSAGRAYLYQLKKGHLAPHCRPPEGAARPA